MSLIIAGILAFSLPVAMFAAGEEKGGTEGTEVDGQVAGGAEWNEIHGFAILEEGEKIDEEFNITISESVKFKDGKHSPGGHIFGELDLIHWDDQPEPSITISEGDFETYSDDGTNLTVYIYGDWYNNKLASDQERYAYKTVLVEKPNNPPRPVAWVAEEGNWTWFNLSEASEVEFIVEEGDDITLWFNAEASWDPDAEEDLAEWKWDFDEDGSFGGVGETGENLSKVLTTGKTYNLGLKVWDERGRESESSLDFTIIVSSPPRMPDLEVMDVEYSNENANKQNYQVKDHIIIQPKIKNIGENDTESAFKVKFEYSTNGGADYSLLGERDITEPIAAGNLKLLSYTWDTEGYQKGGYIIKVTADTENVIDEANENNNENTTNIINLEEEDDPGTADVEIEFISAEKTTIKVNELVNITVSVINVGDGDANFVDIDYDIEGEFIYLQTINEIAAGFNATAKFSFSPDAAGTYTLGFIMTDDDKVGERETITITVEKDTNGGGGNGGDNEPEKKKDDGGFIPGFEVIASLGAIMAALVLAGKRRR